MIKHYYFFEAKSTRFGMISGTVKATSKNALKAVSSKANEMYTQRKDGRVVNRTFEALYPSNSETIDFRITQMNRL